MDGFFIFLFALAVSVDGMMVGVAYGIRKISIPIASLLIIACTSILAVSISMSCGKGMALILPPETTMSIGAVLLVLIGCYYFLRALKDKVNSISNESGQPLLSLNIKPVGIIVQILKEPSTADFDASGVINNKEAVFLGLALAMDSFGAGFGLAMTGLFNIIYVALAVGMLQFILIKIGTVIGRQMIGKRFDHLAKILPGFILVAIGISKLI